MKPEHIKFQEKLDTIANAQAGEAICRCRAEVLAAIGRLIAHSPIEPNGDCNDLLWDDGTVRQVCNVLASGNSREGWPKCIWERRRAALEHELLNAMAMLATKHLDSANAAD
jgi:hypothetical protein